MRNARLLKERDTQVFPLGGTAVLYIDQAELMTGSLCLTYQHLGHTVLFPHIAEIPRAAGLKPDVLPVDCSFLEDTRDTLHFSNGPQESPSCLALDPSSHLQHDEYLRPTNTLCYITVSWRGPMGHPCDRRLHRGPTFQSEGTSRKPAQSSHRGPDRSEMEKYSL